MMTYEATIYSERINCDILFLPSVWVFSSTEFVLNSINIFNTIIF